MLGFGCFNCFLVDRETVAEYVQRDMETILAPFPLRNPACASESTGGVVQPWLREDFCVLVSIRCKSVQYFSAGRLKQSKK